jgi:hypothetical protein
MASSLNGLASTGGPWVGVRAPHGLKAQHIQEELLKIAFQGAGLVVCEEHEVARLQHRLHRPISGRRKEFWTSHNIYDAKGRLSCA